MNQESSLNILFVINPVSGGKTKVDYPAAIDQYFEPLPHRIHTFILSGKNDTDAINHQINKIKPDRVVAVGGDGTVTLVAKQILGTPLPMAILPAGSANGMAKELNISTNINDALDVIVNGTIKCSDVIEVNNQICLHLSDIGLNAQLIKYFDEGDIRGMLGYARLVFKVLWRKQNIQVIIQSKDKEIKRDAFMVVLANASKYGTGAVINPQGDLYDGLFEVVIIKRLAFFQILKTFLRPRSFNPKKIEVFHASSVTIETYKKVHFQIDGEYVGKVKKIVAKVLPAQLNLVLPKDTSDNGVRN
ncbi:MAG TPA: diacylglycerol kinase family protein [Segetibacter sp.]|jgi:YegS/Rv2252/BmrU family lipid kinase